MVVASEAMFAAGAILRVMTGSGDSVIRTDRFDMRRFGEDDLPAMVGYRSDPQVARYQSWDSDWSMKDAVQFLAGQQGVAIGQRGEWVQLAIEERATGRLCGDVAVNFVETQPRTVEVGITLAAECQGQGVATEALDEVLQWLFADFDVHRVFAHADERNTKVRALMDRLGFRQEAELREADWFKGEWTSLCVYGLLQREWRDRDRTTP
jgi:RimJ/RimL family protein N-acetyltransferase